VAIAGTGLVIDALAVVALGMDSIALSPRCRRRCACTHHYEQIMGQFRVSFTVGVHKELAGWISRRIR
jgi:hypothetical protein